MPWEWASLLPLCSPRSWYPKGHLVSSISIDWNPLGYVGTTGFLAGIQASATGNSEQESNRFCKPDIVTARLRQGERKEWSPGMQEECLGGLFLSPTPELPGASELRLLARWALGSMEGNGLGPEHPWGWGALSEGQ